MLDGFRTDSRSGIEDCISVYSWSKQRQEIYDQENKPIDGIVGRSHATNSFSVTHEHMSFVRVERKLLGSRRLVRPQLGLVISLEDCSIVSLKANEALWGVPLGSQSQYAKIENDTDYESPKAVVAAGIMAILHPGDYPEMQSSYEEFSDMFVESLQSEIHDRSTERKLIRVQTIR